MPRKTKEIKEDTKIEEKKIVTKKSTSVLNTPKKTTQKKETKTAPVKSTTKSVSSKMTSSKKATTRVTSPEKSVASKKETNTTIAEYYDLPYRYNQTIVKILAQTPHTLFVYWDISNNDRRNLEKKYGFDFFSITKPVLIIHNETLKHDFEIEINDFANSWYLQVTDSNCQYRIELGRIPKSYTTTTKYVSISSSNTINSPNDHVLFEHFKPKVTYKNIQNNTCSSKDLKNLANYENDQNIYHLYDLYQTIYQDELLAEINKKQPANPSSDSFSGCQ